MSDHSRHILSKTLLGDGVSAGLSVFVRTAQSGSFAKAAGMLGLTPSGASKAVQRLEARLGVALFTRTTRSLSLTEAGEMLLGHADRILEASADAEAALAQSGAEPRGRIRASFAPGIGRAVILPTLGAFLSRYPEISLDIDFDSRAVDIVGSGYDLALRTGTIPDSELRGRRLTRLRSMLCAAPYYLERRGTPMAPEALARHACIRYRSPSTGRLQPWPLVPVGTSVPETLVFGEPDAIRISAVAGFGIALLPLYAARPGIDSGALVAVLPDAMTETNPSEVWLLWPGNRHPVPKIRAFIDHIAALFDGAD
jgi:DNA-binding transcriptional LysR family regulator